MALNPSEYYRLKTVALAKYRDRQPPSQPLSRPAPRPIAGPSTDELMSWLATAEPDYSRVAEPDFDAIAADARAQVDDWKKDVIGERDSLVNLLGGQKKLSQDASTNFNAALANILTGGLEGQAGRDYAFKTFGGSYLGEIQTVEGQKMFSDITRDFDAKTWELLAKYDKVLDKAPDMYDQLYNDLADSEWKLYQQGLTTADGSFEHRVKAALALLQVRKQQETNAVRERINSQDNAIRERMNSQDNLTKFALAKMKGGGGTVNAQLKKIGGRFYYFDPQSRTLTPTGLADPAAKKTPRTWVDRQNGITYRVNPDGTFTQTGTIAKPPKKPAAASASAGKKIEFNDVRKEALGFARDMFNDKERPDVSRAYSALMEGYGRVLLGAGYRPKTVQTMLRRIMIAASGGLWDPSRMGPPAPGVGVGGNPLTG